jgi:broad specificity phosphatase PhoE
VEDIHSVNRGQQIIKLTVVHKMEKRNYPSLQDFLTELNENCLLLARHGETDWNAMKIIQGQQDRPLSVRGFEQRRNLFFLLSHVPLSRICCSALQRTTQTAIPISMERNMQLEQKCELNEVRLGIFEGQQKEDFSDDFSRTCYQSFLDDEVNVALPGGGESLRMADRRVRCVVADCIDTVVSSGHVLIVGHRNINKMIIKNLMDLSVEEGYRVEHKNSWLYLFAPRTSGLFLVKIPTPQEPIQVYLGMKHIGKESRTVTNALLEERRT